VIVYNCCVHHTFVYKEPPILEERADVRSKLVTLFCLSNLHVSGRIITILYISLWVVSQIRKASLWRCYCVVLMSRVNGYASNSCVHRTSMRVKSLWFWIDLSSPVEASSCLCFILPSLLITFIYVHCE